MGRYGKYSPELRKMILDVLGEQEKKCMLIRDLIREVFTCAKVKWSDKWNERGVRHVVGVLMSRALRTLEWEGKVSLRPYSVVHEGVVYVMESEDRLNQRAYFVARYDSPYFGHYHPAEVDYDYQVLEVDRGTWYKLYIIEKNRRAAIRRRKTLRKLKSLYLGPAQPSVDESDQITPIAADHATTT